MHRELSYASPDFIYNHQLTGRIAADLIHLLELASHEDAAIVLASRLPEETSRRVRHAISSELLQSNNPDLHALETVNTILPQEKDECARFAMVRYVGSHLDVFPQGKATLIGLFQREPPKRIRQFIIR